MDPLTKREMIDKFGETSDQYAVDYLIGQGAFGKVYKAHRKDTPNKFVAIKHMNSVREGMGIPQDAYREIKILKELSRFPHANIVTLERVFMNPQGSGDAPGLSLVYDYAEHDLGEIIRHHRKQQTRIEPRIVKSMLCQLLKGIMFLHENWIMHRDLKPPNILLAESGPDAGLLKIADFGLARLFQEPLRSLAADGDVVTIWYRAPELLLGAKHYTRAIDVWAIGCIFGELMLGRALFPGTDVKKKQAVQADQLKKIFKVLGKPSLSNWPDMQHLMYYKEIASWSDAEYSFGVPQLLKIDRGSAACDLFLRLLEFDPKQRITAEDALQHRYFTELPAPHQNVFMRAGGQIQRYPSRLKPVDTPKKRKTAGNVNAVVTSANNLVPTGASVRPQSTNSNKRNRLL